MIYIYIVRLCSILLAGCQFSPDRVNGKDRCGGGHHQGFERIADELNDIETLTNLLTGSVSFHSA